jgi:hypothetical protein
MTLGWRQMTAGEGDTSPPPTKHTIRSDSQRQGSFLQETPPGGPIRCLLCAGPGAICPSPQHRFRISPPNSPHPAQRERAGPVSPSHPGASDSGEGSPGMPGGDQARRPVSSWRTTVKQSPKSTALLPTRLVTHLELSVSWSQDAAPTPSQRAEPAEGLHTTTPRPSRYVP